MVIAKDEFTINTDTPAIDIVFVHRFLSTQSYWAKDIPFETVQRSINNSLNFGVFHKNEQVGFARIISDYATIAYLGDVFITATYRGKGLSKWLLEAIMQHPQLQGLRRWVLLTADAHDLYKKYGWKPIEKAELYMEIATPALYKQEKEEI